MKYKYLSSKNIYTIPVGDFFSNPINDCFLVYSPLANLFFLALPQEVEQFENLVKENQSNEILEALGNYTPLKNRNPYGEGYESSATFYLLLNEKCNFHCKYCYSAEGRSKAELSIDNICVALDYFLSKERKAPMHRTVMFMGGGEPTLSWKLVEQATMYAEDIAKKNGIELKMELSTNGSIMTYQMLDFYRNHNFELQFSFDVLPDVQNEQRGPFEVVSSNLKKLGENNIKCRIRSTITDLNVDRMAEMVQLCHKEYPSVTCLTCEHVVDPEFFTTADVVQSFYDRYFNSFLKAQSLADMYNINLFSTLSGTIRALRERFCYNLYCMTPYNTFTTCPNISSPNETGYDEAIFGHINQEAALFDDNAYKRLTQGSIHTYEKCKYCWAKWNCGGGCPNQRRIYRSEIFDEICIYLKKMLRYKLITELSEKYKENTGKDFYSEITNILKK